MDEAEAIYRHIRECIHIMRWTGQNDLSGACASLSIPRSIYISTELMSAKCHMLNIKWILFFSSTRNEDEIEQFDWIEAINLVTV